jgi:hypothetical protein
MLFHLIMPSALQHDHSSYVINFENNLTKANVRIWNRLSRQTIQYSCSWNILKVHTRFTATRHISIESAHFNSKNVYTIIEAKRNKLLISE